MGIKISGKLSAFGAFAIAFLILAFVFQQVGSNDLSNLAQSGTVVILFIIVLGAILSMKSRLFSLLR